MNESTPLVIEAGGIRAGSRVLDLGSGPGNTANLLARTGATVTGIDFSPEMVRVARTTYPEITFEQADAERLPYEDGSFDAVVASYLLHRLARPEVVLREAHRVLRPGGAFVFALFGEGGDQSSVIAFFEAVEAHHDLGEGFLPPLYGVTESSVFESMLTSAGFPDCQLSVHGFTWQTESLEPVIRGFWDYANMSLLPENIQEKVASTMSDNVQGYRRNGGYAFPHTTLIGSARKR